MLTELVKSRKVYLDKSEETSGNKYRVYLQHNGKQVSFIYHDNYKNQSGTKDFLYSLLLDANAYEDSRNLEDFCDNYCYDMTDDKIFKKGAKAYNECKKQCERLYYLFTDEEISQLSNELEDF